jgi:hypothetical protein
MSNHTFNQITFMLAVKKPFLGMQFYSTPKIAKTYWAIPDSEYPLLDAAFYRSDPKNSMSLEVKGMARTGGRFRSQHDRDTGHFILLFGFKSSPNHVRWRINREVKGATRGEGFSHQISKCDRSCREKLRYFGRTYSAHNAIGNPR